MLYWSNVSARSRLALSSNSRKYPRGRSVSLLRTMRTSAIAHALAVKSPTTSSLGHSYGKLPTNAVKGGEDGTGIVGRTGRASLPPARPGDWGEPIGATPLVDAPGPGGDAPKRKPAPPGDVGPENPENSGAPG